MKKENSRNIVGKNVRKYRKQFSLTQDELSARLFLLDIKLDRPMISKIENGLREVTDFEVKALAKSLGIQIENLFY